ncbi:DUF1850 domain-containing protein [Rhizobium halophytocola]|uniref:DUF1850 domain-containing protein n=1 Tax=Rhizobium halophytocola TaxID=735519 RepID=A0ABS4DTP8_9HYPH|nr:DUF1850 domain-containing protein [Rhizobium halophytocola]MBP1849051.1 hypothetical protein [Rhizobium halophytocola]
MPALCILTGAKTITLAAGLFTLSWLHSVEKTEWRESWRLAPDGLELTEARVKGSGAGMDPGEGAVLEGDWWVWQPKLPPQPSLHLAASGATVSPWTLCTEAKCLALGGKPGAGVTIKPCDG